MFFACGNGPDYVMSYLSPGCLALTGYTTGELLAGRPSYNSIMVAEDLPGTFEAIAIQVGRKQSYQVEYRIQTKSGQLKWVLERGVGIFDSQGNLSGFEGLIDDISEAKQSLQERQYLEIELRQHRSQLEDLVQARTQQLLDTNAQLQAERAFRKALENAIPIGIVSIDLQGRQTYVNPAFCRMVGWTEAELLGQTLPFYYWRPEDIACLTEMFTGDQTAATRRSELCFQRQNGEQFDVLYISSPLLNPDGNMMGWIASVYDISDSKRLAAENSLAESALHQSEALYRSVVENTKEVIFQADLLGNWTFLNPAWTEITEFAIAESLDTPFWHYVHPEDRERNLQLVDALFKQEKPNCRHEVRYLTKSGQVRWLEAFAHLTFDVNQQVTGVAGTLNDMTDRKQAEIARQESQARLHRQNLALIDLAKRPSLYQRDFQLALAEIAHMAAHTLEVEQVGIFLYGIDRTHLRCLSLYRRSSDCYSEGEILFASDFPTYFQALETERIIVAHDARNDPGTIEFRDHYLPSLGITSILDAPIWVGGKMVGVVCHEHTGKQRQWTSDEQSFAAAIADLVALAIESRDRQQAEQKYRSIFENAMEGIWQTTPDGRYLSMNPCHARILGYKSPAEAIQSLQDLTHQVYVEPSRRQEFIQKLSQQGIVTDFEAEYFRRDGSTFWAIENARAVYGQHGELLYYEGTTIDITARRQAEAALSQTNQRLLDTLESITSGFFSLGCEDEFTYINRQAESLLQKSREQLLGTNLWQSFPELQNSRFFDVYQEAITQRVAIKFEEFFPSFDRWLEIHAYPAVSGLSVYLHDISDRKRTEAALLETKERYALSILGANDGIWDWNLLTNEIYYSPRWKSMLGHTEDEVGSRPEDWFSRIHPQDLERVQLNLALHQLGQTQHFEQEYRIQHRNGDYRWVLSRGIAVRDREGKAYRMAGSLTDNTERHLAEERLLHDAMHDPLTKLPNRALFMDRLEQAIRHARRRSDYQFAVLFLDLDRFKVINDSLGHLVGDQLLIELSERLLACLRPEHTIARLGGDEFVILIDDLEGVEDATAVASRIQEMLAQPFSLNGQIVFTTASIGITLNTPQCQQPQDYLRNADIAMYQAKTHGGERHALFTNVMFTSAIARLQLETDLRRAIERQELRLHYQPILSLATEKLIGFEALVRWQHPIEGLIFPSRFITLAEETGLIMPIGYWVLREACSQMQSWLSHLPADYPLMISVNLSSKQLAHPNLIEQVDQILTETGLPPSRLKLEITESMVLENTEAAQKTLHQLKERQIQLSMDDFGTGYSSLNYLHRLPIDVLKIDRSFINEMDKSEESLELVKAIVSIAHSLKMDVVAEGIETRAQLQQLQTLNCKFGQGYLFSRPVDDRIARDFVNQLFQDVDACQETRIQ